MFPGTNHQGEQPGWHFGFVSSLVHYNAFIHLRECEKKMGLIYQMQNIVCIMNTFSCKNKDYSTVQKREMFLYLFQLLA